MIKEFSIDNWIIGGTVFILIFTLGCYLWFQNEIAHIQQGVDPHVEIQHVEQSSKTEQIELIRTKQSDALKKNRTDSEDASDVTSNNITRTRQENIESAAANSMPS